MFPNSGDTRAPESLESAQFNRPESFPEGSRRREAMSGKLFDFIEEIKVDKRCESFDEASIKQGVVLKILSHLGWDPFDTEEIHPAYDVKGGTVDFALRHNKTNKVFIQVKKEVW